jgi:hypothetical protein
LVLFKSIFLPNSVPNFASTLFSLSIAIKYGMSPLRMDAFAVAGIPKQLSIRLIVINKHTNFFMIFYFLGGNRWSLKKILEILASVKKKRQYTAIPNSKSSK